MGSSEGKGGAEVLTLHSSRKQGAGLPIAVAEMAVVEGER